MGWIGLPQGNGAEDCRAFRGIRLEPCRPAGVHASETSQAWRPKTTQRFQCVKMGGVVVASPRLGAAHFALAWAQLHCLAVVRRR